MKTEKFILTPEDNDQLYSFCGPLDEYIGLIEAHLAVQINHRGHHFKVFGPDSQVEQATHFIKKAYHDAASADWDEKAFRIALNAEKQQGEYNHSAADLSEEDMDPLLILKTPFKQIKPRNKNQERYVRRIKQNDINFGVGPAGTGKTYLAVACAVEALEARVVKRILLVRPVVEAGESLGFLPGDLMQKVDPYLRPMYDALYELMGIEKVQRLISQQIIEVAPLAYMRGRTLNDSYIILDESQNTTKEQMKMFLTRLGFNSTAIINGDITQVDLPRGKISGLRHVINILNNVEGISFTFFDAQDVVRHPLVQKIVTAYEAYELNENSHA